jgi:glutamine amidotransferase
MSTITIVDYALGNLNSVSRACEHLGAEVQFAHDAETIRQAERLILPGVGSFHVGMKELRERNLVDALREYANDNRPLLGICLGMQMMLDVSEEFGEHQGLGLIPGRVRAIPAIDSNGIKQKIPHIGWNTLTAPQASPHSNNWGNSLLRDLPGNPAVYFVHSYTAWPSEESHRLADTYHGGQPISAAIQKGRLIGCQFHPEKSGPIGLKILNHFLSED